MRILNLQRMMTEEPDKYQRILQSLIYKAQQVTKDAIQGSEDGQTVAFYVLDAFISIDQERFFLGQLQSRVFLRSCLTDISNISSQLDARSRHLQKQRDTSVGVGRRGTMPYMKPQLSKYNWLLSM